MADGIADEGNFMLSFGIKPKFARAKSPPELAALC